MPRKGRKHSPESRAKISASKLGHTVGVETRRKIGAKNRVFRPEERRRQTWMTHVRLTYGLDPVDIALLWEAQRGLCPLCGHALQNTWTIDHDHKTGSVRGLLHYACNTGLGFVERLGLSEVVAKVAAYLRSAA